MDATYQSLAHRIHQKWTHKQSPSRLLIALAGPPGSGKTTIAHRIVSHVAALPSGPSIVAISADGFHLPLATLRSLPNASEAIARRGAPWTFDAAAVAAMVRRLRVPGEVVACPTFDHAVKDPVEDGMTVGADVEVCIIEGNYLLCDEGVWGEIAGLVDERWLVRVDGDAARRRVAQRHLEAGIEGTMEEAIRRAEGNDMVNGEYVVRNSEGRYDVLIESVDA
ncbi:hypothetical protein ACJ41O_001072 [Fusarium nematophilum]